MKKCLHIEKIEPYVLGKISTFLILTIFLILMIALGY
jgi:hypothetical protein